VQSSYPDEFLLDARVVGVQGLRFYENSLQKCGT
jgi:hypothetical protein